MTAKPWLAPALTAPVQATISLPGSKSLTVRELLLSALASSPTWLNGALCSRDTELMQRALMVFGARFTPKNAAGTSMLVTPAPTPLHVCPPARIDCGLAGTVMRFLPPLAALADAPVEFDGDASARKRPLQPLLTALEKLGATINFLGADGYLPLRLQPNRAAINCQNSPKTIFVDATASSQFLSALLLSAYLHPHGMIVGATGALPSTPHIEMTLECLRRRGITVKALSANTAPAWQVSAGRPAGGTVTIEPDLSNAGPFLGAALIGAGQVSIPHWPVHTTQAGAAWLKLLPRFGAHLTTHTTVDGSLSLTVRGTGKINGINADLTDFGELTPVVAALALLASAQGHSSRLTGIAHLRGHETDRLHALVTEMNRLGGKTCHNVDSIEICALPRPCLKPALVHTYADHRMATFAALLGLAIPGIELDDIACTGKTFPDFPALWATLTKTQILRPAPQQFFQ